jgi:hypothetical protein
MRLWRKKRAGTAGEAQRATGAAQAARAEAGERLAEASEARTSAERQSEREHATIISELREMRRRNNLAQMILDSVEGKRRLCRGGSSSPWRRRRG